MNSRMMGGRRFNFDKVTIEKGTTKRVLKRLWGYLKKHPWYMVFIGLSSTLLIIFNLAVPTILRYAIDNYIDISEIDIKAISIITLAIIIASVLVSISNYFEQYIVTKLATKVATELRRDAFKNLLQLPIRYFDQNAHGVIMSNLTNDVEAVSNALSQVVPQLLIAGLTIIGSVTLMFITSWQLALVVLAVIPLMIFSTIYITKKSAKHYQAQQEKIGVINGIVKEDINGLKVVKLYNQEEKFKEKFAKANEELRKSSFTGQIYSGMLMPIIRLVDNIIYGLVVTVGAILFIDFGSVSVGKIQAIINYARMATRPINSIAQVYNILQIAIVGADRVFRLIDQDSEFSSSNGVSVTKLDGQIKFDNVNFGYNENLVLKNINFDVKPGETIAIVGPTGGGKTTIINLLMRYYDVTGGNIYIDGINITDLPKPFLRKQIGIVLQTTYLFKGTVLENIRYGKTDATIEEVIEACKRAQVHDIIERLPKKYNTKVKEGGINFSHGERQLMSIARAILADPSILILDEATSSVDTRTEINIQKGIQEILKNRTSFVIAHRLQTIKNADKILVIKNGQIIEQGNHEELLNRKGFYYEMYSTQFAIDN